MPFLQTSVVRCTGRVMTPYVRFPSLVPLLVDIMKQEVDLNSTTAAGMKGRNGINGIGIGIGIGGGPTQPHRPRAGGLVASRARLGSGTGPATAALGIDFGMTDGRHLATTTGTVLRNGSEAWELKCAAYVILVCRNSF